MAQSSLRTAFLLDVYDRGDRMMLWLVDEHGRAFWCWDRFCPTWYFRAAPFFRSHASGAGAAVRSPDPEHRLIQALRRMPGVRVFPTEKRELYAGPIRVWGCEVTQPKDFQRTVRLGISFHEAIELYNSDLPLPHYYLYQRQWFAGARLRVRMDAHTHQLLEAELNDSPWATDAPHPPFTICSLASSGGPQQASEAAPRTLIFTSGGEECTLEGSPREQLEELNHLLKRTDPDIILTQQGDAFLLPQLSMLAQTHGLRLAVHRDPAFVFHQTRPRSYFSYGKIIYKPGSVRFYGRIHLDQSNSFLMGEGGMEAIFELTHITHAPFQQASRSTIGTGLSSMQLFQALQDNILIPAHKHVPEAWKSVATLFQTDKGGLVYQPRPGFYEGVAQLDFSSLYPFLMVKHNISPETIACACCPDAPGLPESGVRVCQKREGLIPRTLRPLVEKRQHYKRRMKTTSDPLAKAAYNQRQQCHKWLLVTCFGYLGYKNARFGRIEAHEAVTTLGRETLLRAKEVAEANGFQFYHAIVDCLWVKKEHASEQDYQKLAEDISTATGIPMEMEGIYKWLGFLPARGRLETSVANRYFGAFTTGETKIRGLEQRRHDTPRFIKNFQTQMIRLLAHADNLAEYQALFPKVFEELRCVSEELENGRIPFEDLLIQKNLSRNVLDYKVKSPTAVAAEQLREFGIEMQAGMRIAYLFTNARAQIANERVRALTTYDINDGLDTKRYLQLLLRSVETLYQCFGIDEHQLQQHLGTPNSHPEAPPTSAVRNDDDTFLLQSSSTTQSQQPRQQNESAHPLPANSRQLR